LFKVRAIMSHFREIITVTLIVAVFLPARTASAQATGGQPRRYQPTDAEKTAIQAEIDMLAPAVPARTKRRGDDALQSDLVADVEICLKAARWILHYDEFFNKNYVEMTLNALRIGRERARLLAAGEHPWTMAKGSTVRGFVSRIDGSVQPYAIIVPASYSGAHPARLDVILHGRIETLNEVGFIQAHHGKPAADDQNGLVLHVLGRTNNAFRWAGETDVFEAIDAVKRNYAVDDQRIVLRGFSMGGAGAWHLGLHYPSLWCSVEAGAGFTETKRYARLRNTPPYQEKALHIYDAVDYAQNAFDVPMAGYGGEMDPQLQASVNIKDALESMGFRMQIDGLVSRGEGIDFLHVVGAKMGHRIDPASERILRAFHDERAQRAIDPLPRKLAFTTYTLKYNQVAWLTLVELEEHYRRATIKAEIHDKKVHIEPENVVVLGVDPAAGETVEFGDQQLPLSAAGTDRRSLAYFEKADGRWERLDDRRSRALVENADRAKRHGLQGPIDDAFTGPFLCVRGTGEPWNPKVQAWADARLKAFAVLWPRWLRGDLPVKNDVDVTAADIADRSLILFGDPGSNRLIARVLPDLQLAWTRSELALKGTFSAADHAPVLIGLNPLNPERYVVINSGHTFDDKAFAGTNALLFPRLGDYAVIRVNDSGDEVRVSDYFDEHWKMR
jgi:pimeloyl-ACP methyl ester carboxylesterase